MNPHDQTLINDIDTALAAFAGDQQVPYSQRHKYKSLPFPPPPPDLANLLRRIKTRLEEGEQA